MTRAAGRRSTFALVFVVALGAVGFALASQHGFDMRPCPWCVLQRLLFVVIAAVAALGWLGAATAASWIAALALSVLSAFGILAALWQHFVAAASASCKLTLADRILSGLGLDELLPLVFAPTASCADARVDLLGVPYEFYSLALFVAIDVLATLLLVKRQPAASSA